MENITMLNINLINIIILIKTEIHIMMIVILHYQDKMLVIFKLKWILLVNIILFVVHQCSKKIIINLILKIIDIMVIMKFQLD